MNWLYLAAATVVVVIGHFFRTKRWKSLISVYEDTSDSELLSSMSFGYLTDIFLPFHSGDFVRAVYTGRHLTNKTAFSLATIIIDRLLDVLIVSLLYLGFYLFKGSPCFPQIIVYSVITVILFIMLAWSMTFGKSLKKAVLALSSVFNEKIQLWILGFGWSCICTFENILHKINKPLLILRTVCMWICYMLSYKLLGAAVEGGSTFSVFNTIFALRSFSPLIEYINSVFLGQSDSSVIIMCRVMKELSLHLATIIISLIAYSTSILFFSYAFYYFTFNNFFFMPLFLWIMMRTRNYKSRWFVPGIIMAFSLLMGHVQYSCYYVIAYCIIQVVFAVQDKDWKTILPIFTTIALFAGLSSVFSVIAFANIVYITYSGMHPYINNKIFDYQHYRKTEQEITAQMKKVGVDSNYRFLTFGKSTLAPETSIEISSQICTYGLTKNYCTVYGVFSLAGYDNIFTTKGFEQSDMLLSSINIEGMMCNMVANTTMYRGYMESKDKIKVFETQMIENGVKYVLLPKNDAEVTDIFNELIDTCEQLKIIRTVPWSHDYVLTELDGVKPICSYDNMEKLPLETSLDVLRFQTDFTETKTVTISMTYDPHYIMRLTDSKGTVSELQLKESSSGYVTAEIPAGKYSVKFYYENFVMDLAVILALVTLLLTAVAIFVTAKQPIEAKSDITKLCTK